MSSPLDDLLVCIPRGELGYGAFQAYLEANPDYGYLVNQRRVLSKPGGYIHTQPTQLLKLALEADNVPPWKRLMWLEHDHFGPLDMFQRHARYTQAMVSALYVYRDPEKPIPVIYKWDEGRHNALYYNAVELETMGIFDDELDSPRRGLHQVDVVPMGCLSVAREVFEDWPADIPYYSSYTSVGGSTTGHDVWFARIAQDQGWKIFVDTSFRVKHYAQIPLDDSYFAKWWRLVRQPQAIAEAEEDAKVRLTLVK